MNDGLSTVILTSSPHSPLARICIESLTVAQANQSKKSTNGSAVLTPAKEVTAIAPAATNTAREVQRDNMLVDMQLQITEMEKRLFQQIEKSLNLKMLDLQNKIGVPASSPTSLDKYVQVDKHELREAEAHYKAQKARENPTQAILESLPKIIETITSSIEKSYRFKNQTNSVPKRGNSKSQDKNSGNRPKANRHSGHNAQNSNPRR